MDLLKPFATLKLGLTTYRLGLLQARAYRILKKNSSDHLVAVDISTLDWALLGLLYDTPKGHRLNKVAELLGVEAPFVTEMVKALKRKGYVEQATDIKDSRAKILKLTTKGKEFVPILDSSLKKKLRFLLAGASPKDIYGYLKVLKLIVGNESKS